MTVPGPGQPGNETWSGDSWKNGGAGVWNTGSYDSELNLTYWGTGNPSPFGATSPPEPIRADARLGDNLYSASVVALDADTGTLKWHYQFTPHDDMDWDAAQVPVLADLDWQGRHRKVLLFANKNGLMYVLDRVSGQFLMAKKFVEINWLDRFNEKGAPLRVPGKVSTNGSRVLPFSGTNWYPQSYSPNTGLYYIPAWERGSEWGVAVGGTSRGALVAFDPRSGERKWEFALNDAIFTAGALTTASHLLFTGTSGDFYSTLPSPEAIASGTSRSARINPPPGRLVDGYFFALDARTGEVLWKLALGGSLESGSISYSVAGKQYVAVAAGNTLFAFALRR
jgi:alcohol dehydrogenase (cytochrome c)